MITKVTNRIKTIYLELVCLILKCVGHVPSHHVRRFFYRMLGVRIGSGSTIHTGAVFYNPYNITIGEDSIIGEGVVLDGRGRISIGSHVDFATDVMIYNSQHDINDPQFKATTQDVVVEDYVFVGPRAIILPGVTLGRACVVGAGAVVTKSVPAGEVWGGVPAARIGERQLKDPNYRLGRAAWFR